ncbi:MAG: agmatine deiminase family protein [Bryobacteraceae bacterium]|nr:agmatine deiminase family protein [Bryobacteraceae bacterium]
MATTTRYRMPAEWEPHEGTWLAWPHERTDWPGKFEPIPWVYCDIVRRLSRVERVHILINDPDSAELARVMLEDAGANLAAVDFFECPTDRSWTRDFCPIWVRDEAGRPVILNWGFNGWAKYDNWQVDDAVPSAVAARLGTPEVQPVFRGRRVVLEGGSIDVNGLGTILTTEECLLSDVQSRNPGLTREDLEDVFAQYLGIRHTLWLRNGIYGDDTHGHVDDLARFTDPRTVVIASEADPASPNYEPLLENISLLREMRDQDGEPLRVVPLPMPAPVEFAGQPLPASYANFYIANKMVLVPTFNDPRDRVALNTLAELFPDREVTGIHCLDLVLGLGTLHCMTQQQIAC